MSEEHQPGRFQVALAVTVVLFVLAMQATSLWVLWEGTGRAVGIYIGTEEDPLELSGVIEDTPAEEAGLETGDRLLTVDGFQLDTVRDYDIPAADLERGEPVAFRVERDGEVVDLVVRPGLDLEWTSLGINLFVVLFCLGMGFLTFSQSGGDIRGRLLALFFFLLALELAFPPGQLAVGEPFYFVLAYTLFLLLTGGQMAVQLHLASVIPERQSWLDRTPWAVPAFYVVGLGTAVVTAVTFVLESTGDGSGLPWTSAQAETVLLNWGLLVWATGIALLLGRQALRYRNPQGRQQALLVLLGMTPWILYVYSTTIVFYVVEDAVFPEWVNDVFPFIILCFPVAVFVAIYRYHLFDMEVVLRRSLVYTALTTSLVAIFYAFVGVIGLAFSRITGQDRYSIWVVGAAMFLIGLLFGTLRDALQTAIDRVFFPERQELRRRLVEVAGELPARGTISSMGRHLVERLGEIFGVRYATLLLSEPKGGVFYTVASHPPEERSARSALSFLVPPDDPVLERLRGAGRPLAGPDVLEESRVLSRHFEPGEGSMLVPLLVQERLIGLVVLGPPEPRRRFRREETELLNLLAHHVAVTFENIRLFESATYESLTGLLRRGAILDLLRREIERALRYSRPLVVGMADLDFFKSVNDRYGHLAGDAVLKRVADELSSGLRSTDSIGRYGGEEFLLVLPETDMDGGRRVAEKLRRRIEALELPMSDGSTVEPRISVGLAQLDADAATESRALLEAADKALYKAKAAGRNRVVLHHEALETG